MAKKHKQNRKKVASKIVASKKVEPAEKIVNKSQRTFFEKAQDYYFNNYKKLFVIPIILFVLAGLVLFSSYARTGEFLKRDVSLKGGISLTIDTDYSDITYFENTLNQKFLASSLNIRTIEASGKIKGIIIEASDIKESELVSEVNKIIPLTKNNYSLETMGSSLGDSFFKQMFIAVLLAFFSMGLVFQFYFKSWYATFAALFSAFMDIFITIGIMDFFGIRLTAGGIAAYLMLIGYSIDTSILLSTKLLKEKGDLRKLLFGAMKTGLTMSAAGIAATGISFLFTNNSTLKQIMLILIVGLFIDLITTWIGNVTFLRLYLEKKNVKN